MTDDPQRHPSTCRKPSSRQRNSVGERRAIPDRPHDAARGGAAAARSASRQGLAGADLVSNPRSRPIAGSSTFWRHGTTRGVGLGGVSGADQSRETSDIHCVTSGRATTTHGRSLNRRMCSLQCPQADARFVVLHSYDGLHHQPPA